MKKEAGKKLEIEVRGVLGAATTYRQGGSVRIILPKRVTKYYSMKLDEEEGSIITLMFVETDKGIFLQTTDDVHKDSSKDTNF